MKGSLHGASFRGLVVVARLTRLNSFSGVRILCVSNALLAVLRASLTLMLICHRYKSNVSKLIVVQTSHCRESEVMSPCVPLYIYRNIKIMSEMKVHEMLMVSPFCVMYQFLVR